MQDDALSLMLQARNLMFPNVRYLKQYNFSLLMNKILLQLVIDETYVCLEIATLRNIC